MPLWLLHDPPVLDERLRPAGPFEPSWSLHPSVLIGTALLAALYVWGIGPARRRWSLGPPAGAWRILAFVLSTVVLLVSLNGPIHDLSDYYLFWVHMVQHLLLTLVWPPLLLLSLPDWLLRPVLVRPAVLPLWRFFTRPLVAGLIFTATIAFWHTIRFYDLMMRVHEVHILTHLMFMAAAILLWWPVMSPLKEAPPLPMGFRMLYIFLASLPMQLVAALITFADTVLYPWYADAPRTFGLDVENDQLLGALLMWIPGNLYMFGAIGIIFFLWARQEKA